MIEQSPATKEELDKLRLTVENQQTRLYQEISERGDLYHRFFSLLEQQEAILSSIPALIYIRDIENRIITANERFLKAFNIPQHSLPLDLGTQLNASGLELLLTEDGDLLENNHSIILEERLLDLSPQGKTWFWVSKVPFHSTDQQVLGLVGSILDISNMKLTQIALEQSEHIFRTLAERSFSAIFIVQNLEIKYCNPLFQSIFSIPTVRNPEAIELFSFFMPDEAAKLKKKCLAIEHDGLSTSRFQLSALPDNNNNSLVFEVYLTQIAYESRPAVLGCLLDITDKYLSALALEVKAREFEALNQQLEQRIERELQKRRQNEDFMLHQSRLAAMGEMIGAIAHQWRQPLTTLSIMIQNLENTFNYSGIDENAIGRFISDSHLHITRMTDSIDQFSRFFASSETKAPLTTIADMLQESIFVFSKTCPNNPIGMTLTPDLKKLKWKGQTNALKQVMISLLGLTRGSLTNPTQADSGNMLSAHKKGNQVHIHLVLHTTPLTIMNSSQANHHDITLEMCKILVMEHMQGKFQINRHSDSAIEFLIELPLK